MLCSIRGNDIRILLKRSDKPYRNRLRVAMGTFFRDDKISKKTKQNKTI